MKGYMHCYSKWEEYNGALMFVLLDNSSFVPEYLDMMRGKLPQSVHQTVMEKMTNIFLKTSRKSDKVFQQLEIVNELVDDALFKVSPTKLNSLIFNSATNSSKLVIKNECNL
jgi:hypothetical protein